MSLRRVFRSAWPLLLAAAIAAVLAHALRAEVRDIIDVPIVVQQPGWREVPVPLDRHARSGGITTFRIELSQPSPGALLAHPEVALLVGAYGRSLTIVSAALRLTGTACAYVTRSETTVGDDRLLLLQRQASCDPATAGEASSDWELRIRTRGDRAVAVGTFTVPTASMDPRFLFVAPEAGPATADDVRLVVRGRSIDPTPPSHTRRIDLLNYMWQIDTSRTWLWRFVLGACALVAIGGWLLPLGATVAGQPARRVAARTAAAMFSFALGLGILYSVLVPPFQAPDEPDHFLSYAMFAERPSLERAASPWAQLTHFMRLRFHSDERFRPVDVGRPLAETWDPGEVFGERIAYRSPAMMALWKPLVRPLRRQPAPRVLLALRLANTIVFALAVAGASAALVVSARAVRYPQLLPFFILIVPTLPFFATHVSSFAVLTSAYVLFAAGIMALSLDGGRSHVAGLPLGLGAAVALASSRAAVPLLPVLFVALAGRMVLGTRGDARAAARAVFWGGLAAGLVAYPMLATPEFNITMWPGDVRAVPPGLRAAVEYARVHTWALVLLAPIGFAAEGVAAWARRRVNRRPHPRVVRALAYGLAAAILLSPLASWWLSNPELPSFESTSGATLRWYVERVFVVMATSVRLTSPDLFLARTFWGAFGWIDTLPPPELSVWLTAASALALVALLVHFGRTSDGRRLSFTLFVAAGMCGALVLYAASSFFLLRNLHGRYLIGFYLVGLACAWSAAALTPPWRRMPALPPRPAVAVCAALLVHAWCLRFILGRYF